MTGMVAQVRCDDPALHVDLDVEPGETLALLGPNGAGKSTTLAVLAGLRHTADSRIMLGDKVLQDDRRYLPPHRRSVVLLTQRARLFPHLNVRRNVAYGPSAARLGRAEVTARTDRWLAATGTTELADEMPGRLSGGQAQRVAIARALAAEPDVLLLDEPFSSLDVSVAQEIRSMLRELIAHHDGITVLVTHDPIDAVSLAGRMVVLDGGRVVDHGSTRDVLTSPAHSFTASLSGLNLVIGRRDDDAVVAAGQRVTGRIVDDAVHDTAAAAFSPRAVGVYREVPHGSPRTTLSARITDVLPRGDGAVVRTVCAGHTVDAEVTWAAIADLDLAAGQSVWLSVKASEVRIYGVGASSGGD